MNLERPFFIFRALLPGGVGPQSQRESYTIGILALLSRSARSFF
jgi:hypothetical protein